MDSCYHRKRLLLVGILTLPACSKTYHSPNRQYLCRGLEELEIKLS